MTDRDMPPGCPLHQRAVPFYAESYTSQTWEQLRARFGTVAPIELEPGVAAWLVLGYNENVEVLRNPSQFSRDPRNWLELTEGRMKPDSPLMPIFGYRPNMVYTDGAEHQRYRSAVDHAMTRLSKQQLRLDTRELADQLIDRFIADGRAELIEQYCRWLPILVMNRVFGMEDRHGYLLAELAPKIFEGDPAAALQAGKDIEEYFGYLVSVKRERPGDDLVSWMMTHPANLSDEEMSQNLVNMMLGNSEPTSHLIGNTLLALLTDREFLAAYTRSELQVEEAVNRALWQDPSIAVLPMRVATSNTHIGGTPIRAGEGVLNGLAAAHQDPVVAAHHSSQSAYVNRAYLAWGVGPHRCPAERLARQIVNTAITELLQRIPAMRLAVPVEELARRPSWISPGLVTLPVMFPPGQQRPPQQTPPATPTREPQGNRKSSWLARLAAWLGGGRQG